MTIQDWALRWNVPLQALQELNGIFGIDTPSPAFQRIEDQSETYVQSLVRLEAARKGLKLWRNNVGVLTNENGTPVRYGLANDSPALNRTIKSGDLIGWRSLIIQPADVGRKIAQFVSRECKKPKWNYTGTDHEVAQLRWIHTVSKDGGDAAFAKGEGTL